jgi:predicted deacetylase
MSPNQTPRTTMQPSDEAKARRVLVCVHDVTPRHAERLVRIDAMLAELGVGARYSMLVVPDFWGAWPLADHPEFVRWLRGRADAGVEMILHGLYHKDTTAHAGGIDGWRATTLTAGEGEFLGLSYVESRRRLRRGRGVVEAAVEREVHGFVAPAWLYSDGAREALRDLDFAFAESHFRVWRPRTDETVLRGPVVSYASRDRRRVMGSLVWSRASGPLLASFDVTRFAIHPHDLDVPALASEIRRALSAQLARRTPVLYDDEVRRATGRGPAAW